MLDMVAVSKSLFKNITDCRVTNDGIWSDHSALRTEIEMFSCEFSSSAIGAQSTELDRRKLLSENKAAYNSRVTELLSKKKEATGKYEAYMEILEQAAIETSSAPPKVDRAWFDYDRANLMPLIEERNVLLHATRQSDLSPEESIQTKRLLKDKQMQIQEKTKIALSKWYGHQASLVANIDMDPWTAWKASK